MNAAEPAMTALDLGLVVALRFGVQNVVDQLEREFAGVVARLATASAIAEAEFLPIHHELAVAELALRDALEKLIEIEQKYAGAS